MLEVSRDTVAAGEDQLVSCAADQSKYCSICTVTFVPCRNLPFTSWGRWHCLRGRAESGLNSFYAVCDCGTQYRCGVLPGGGACGDMFEMIACITNLQPNEAMARIAPHRSGTISLDQSCRVKILEQGSLN
jgi:hypothetical protein